MMPETKPVCPKCGSDLIVMIANASHCQQCGADFGLDRHPIATAAAERRRTWPDRQKN